MRKRMEYRAEAMRLHCLESATKALRLDERPVFEGYTRDEATAAVPLAAAARLSKWPP